MASSPTPVPSTRSATRLFARISADTLAMISSVSPRQNDIFTNGYFFMKACGQRTLRLIDDGRGIKNDPAFLAGAIEDHLLAVGGAAGEDVLRGGG